MKRLLDMGRVAFLRANGFNAKLVYYTRARSEDGSLENALLLADLEGV